MILLVKIGRNDPCPCGSGKKYKKCCMSKDQKLDNESNSEENKSEEPEKKHPRSDEIENNFHRAYNLLDEGDYSRAAKVFRSIVLMDSNNYRALTGYGKCLAETGMIEEACKYFVKALEINPDYTQASLNLALYRR